MNFKDNLIVLLMPLFDMSSDVNSNSQTDSSVGRKIYNSLPINYCNFTHLRKADFYYNFYY